MSTFYALIYRHQKKLLTLRTKQKQRVSDVNHICDEHMNSIVHNYSSYVLSKDEKIALSYGLENNIPTNTSRIIINTEFEQFYRRFLHHTSHIPEEDLAHIKTYATPAKSTQRSEFLINIEKSRKHYQRIVKLSS